MTSSRDKDGAPPRVAGVITGGVRQATIKRALKAGAGLLELRVDTFSHRSPSELIRHCERLKAVRGARSIPVIITARSKAEGGLHRIPDTERLEIFKSLMEFADYVDIELSSRAILTDVVRAARKTKTKVIVSYHNFTSTPAPARLRSIIKRARAAGADIVKIAATARRPADIRTLAGVLIEDQKLIVIAMGALGASTRVFFPTLGSLVTYGSVTKATAPGQIPIADIKKQLTFYGF